MKRCIAKTTATRILMTIFAVSLMATMAMAEGATGTSETEFGKLINEFLLNVVYPAFGAGIMALLGIILNKVRTKYGLQLTADTEGRINGAVKAGIAYAEEVASARVKMMGAPKLNGSDKMALAAAYVLTQFPKLNRDDLNKKILAMLGQTPGVGASGETAVN